MGIRLVKRVISSILNFFCILMINFLLITSIKGNVATGFLVEIEEKKRIIEEYGFNDPKIVQFGRWLKNLFSGNMGVSYWTNTKINTSIKTMAIETVKILVPSIICAIIITIILCSIIHLKRRGVIVNLIVKTVSYIGISVPPFLLAIIAIMIVTGEATAGDFLGKARYAHIREGSVGSFFELKRFMMPFLAMTSIGVANLFKYLDSLMNDVMNSEFIRFARAKGLGDKIIMYRHAIKFSACSFLEAISLTLIGLVSTQFIVEIVTKWQGLGVGLLNSINMRDYPVIMGIIIYIAMITLIMNMIVDYCYTLLDPRIK